MTSARDFFSGPEGRERPVPVDFVAPDPHGRELETVAEEAAPRYRFAGAIDFGGVAFGPSRSRRESSVQIWQFRAMGLS